MNSILFLFALRMFFYGHMISPWQVVLFEWIHGPIVGLFYPIMTSTAFKISPEGLTTTTTAIAYFMEGLGKCVSVIHCKMLGSLINCFYLVSASGCKFANLPE